MKALVLKVGVPLLALLALVGGFLLWRHQQGRQLEELSYKEYEIRKLIQAGNYKKAEEIISSASSKESPYRPLFLSYGLYLAERTKEQKVDLLQTLGQIVEDLKDPQLKAFYRERYAYELFKKGKHTQALQELEKIKEEDFNYASALLLKAQILEKQGKLQESKAILKKIEQKSSDTYFASVAQALSLRGE